MPDSFVSCKNANEYNFIEIEGEERLLDNYEKNKNLIEKKLFAKVN